MNEIWKTITKYHYKNYEVSNLGRIRNIKTGNILKPMTTSNGYLGVSIRLKKDDRKNQSYLLHRLVALTFLEEDSEKPYVNHIDGDKQNNKISNLEFVTPLENHIHAVDNGLVDYNKSLEKANEVRLHKPIGQFTLDGDLIATYNNYSEMESKTGFKKQCVAKCCNGKYKTSHGYKWRFI